MASRQVRYMIKVRRGSEDDLPTVLELLNNVWEDDYVPHLWFTWVQSPTEGTVLVAECEEHIVGTTYVKYLPHGACWFQAMRVHPDFRRLGVGSALTHAALRESRDTGRSYAYLGIDAENVASLNMVSQLGFRQITEYALLSLALPPLASPAPAREENSRWRKAAADDVVRMLETARGAGRAEFIACWQWQPLSAEALAENIAEGNLWLCDDPAAYAFAGFEDSDTHPHLFDPCGQPEYVKRLIAYLTAALRRDAEVTFEVWLRHDSPLVDYLLHECGFSAEEGYTIWEHPLQTRQ